VISGRGDNEGDNDDDVADDNDDRDKPHTAVNNRIADLFSLGRFTYHDGRIRVRIAAGANRNELV
jgi:hypothetical protein